MWRYTGHDVEGQPIMAYIKQGRLCSLDINRPDSPHSISGADAQVFEDLSRQLGQYLAGTRQGFTIPVAMPATPWHCQVFAALSLVPYGKTISYSSLAYLAGNPKAVRATASVLAGNPLPLLRACHRVVPLEGKDAGNYRWGAIAKKNLLEMEARNA